MEHEGREGAPQLKRLYVGSMEAETRNEATRVGELEEAQRDAWGDLTTSQVRELVPPGTRKVTVDEKEKEGPDYEKEKAGPDYEKAREEERRARELKEAAEEEAARFRELREARGCCEDGSCQACLVDWQTYS